MKKNHYYLYCDASYAHIEQFAVSGYVVFTSTAQHEKESKTPENVKTYFFKEKNNIRAEILGANKALNELKELLLKSDITLSNLDLQLYSDCQTLTNLLGRREKLEATGYISDRKKAPLANTDLYQEFFKLYDELQPEIHWVKGHAPGEADDRNQAHFRVVDKVVRKQLRILVKKENPNEQEPAKRTDQKSFQRIQRKKLGST
jgi:ribonuclease HI